MTRLTQRRQWRQAVASGTFAASQRPVKATLLVLADLMSSTGELHRWRDEMVNATDLPPRTLDRHLQRAVQDGWLVREVPGGHGRRSLYRAMIPGSSAPSMAHNSGSSAPSTRSQLPEVVRHPAANSRKKSASDSERVAVDRQRGRRTAPDGNRVGREQLRDSTTGTWDEWLPTPSKRPSPDTTGRVA